MFYVYCYFNPLKPSIIHEEGFEPFYVGKGKNERSISHLFPSSIKSDPNKHKTNTIKKILKTNQNPIIKIMSTHEIEEDANQAEKLLIKQYGRADQQLGPLCNMTDGGEGTSGKVFTAEYRAKLSNGTKNAIAEGRLQVSSAFTKSRLGKKDSNETKQKRINSRAGYTHSEETKMKLSLAQQQIRQTTEWKAKASAAQKGKKHTLEHIQKSIMNNPRSQPITFMGISYLSFNQAVKTTGISPGKIRKHPTFSKL